MPSRIRSGKRREVHLVIPPHLHQELEAFLRAKSDGGTESLAFLLCGKHRRRSLLRLLTRHLILPEDDCFRQRGTGGVECSRCLDDFVLKMADEESLCIVTLHTHPHSGLVDFSGVDDSHEGSRAAAIHDVFGDRVGLASVVCNRDVSLCRARLWDWASGTVRATEMKVVTSLADAVGSPRDVGDSHFDRQVRAFGSDFQGYLDRVRIGIVGVGGLGSVAVEGLARLGVRRWVLVDPDRTERSNLNRLLGSTRSDAARSLPKVDVALRNVLSIHGKRAEVREIRNALPCADATRSLSDCHLLIAASDNHSSRYALQEIASAYLRPLINVGVGLQASNGKVGTIGVRVSAVPVGGPWCLVCGGLIEAYQVSRERSDPEHREMLRARGYLADTPQPAVYWVNGIAAHLAISMAHSVVLPYRENPPVDLYADLLRDEVLTIAHSAERHGCTVCGSEGGGLRGAGDAYLLQQGNELPDLHLGQEGVADEAPLNLVRQVPRQ